MSAKNTITVFEHDRLTIHDGTQFNKQHLQALIDFNDGGRNIFFTVIRDGLKFSEYVGVISTGNLTIEILPKVDKEYRSTSDKSVWRQVLLDMLQECRLLKVHQISNAFLNLKANSILEIYIKLFLEETEALMQTGLIKKYKTAHNNLNSLKGRIDFSKQFSLNIVHKECFYVHYSSFSADNIFNRILRKTLLLISNIDLRPEITAKVSNLLLNFPELPDIKVAAYTFQQISIDRKAEPYREALLISKMLLLNYRPDIKGGSENVLAILFNMNSLWEEFIFRRLKRQEEHFGIKVNRQQSTDFWRPPGLDKSQTIRPDIIISQGNEEIVIDTKWKMIDGMKPSDEDLKQMFIYNLYWKCRSSILLYPGRTSEIGEGNFHSHERTGEFSNNCIVQKCLIIEDGLLKKNLGSDILQSIFKTKITELA